MRTLSLLALLVLPFTFPFLWGRIQAFYLIWKNAPGRLVLQHQFASYEIKFADKVRNCEHFVMVESKNIALLSCDPGRDFWNPPLAVFGNEPREKGAIWAYDYVKDTVTPIELVGTETDEMHPLGIAFHEPSSTLYVVNHATPGSEIDVFKLQFGDKPRATFKKSFRHKTLLKTPNSMVPISEHELYVTNDHKFPASESKFLANVEIYSGFAGGSVAYVDLDKPDSVRWIARLPFANGMAFLNSTTLVAAATLGPSIHVYDVNPQTHDITEKLSVKLPFLVDNISADKNGKVLMTGHPHMPSVLDYLASFKVCKTDGTGDPAACAKIVPPPTWVAEWSEKEGRKDLYTGDDYITGCTAARDVDKKIGIVSGLYAKGILVWKE